MKTATTMLDNALIIPGHLAATYKCGGDAALRLNKLYISDTLVEHM